MPGSSVNFWGPLGRVGTGIWWCCHRCSTAVPRAWSPRTSLPSSSAILTSSPSHGRPKFAIAASTFHRMFLFSSALTFRSVGGGVRYPGRKLTSAARGAGQCRSLFLPPLSPSLEISTIVYQTIEQIHYIFFHIFKCIIYHGVTHFHI